jgi:hypothetical protein
VDYEQFLFTRNKRRDFTAFVRPADMTNKEVSLLASAFNAITDVAALTSEMPGLYCFPLGAYIFVLRYYDSRRRHAGREIAVIEGIAVRADEVGVLADWLPELVTRQADRLNIVESVADIEDIEVRKSDIQTYTAPEPASIEDDETLEFDINPPVDETDKRKADDLLLGSHARWTEEQLVLPFTAEGREVLVEALRFSPVKPFHFAFGANNDMLSRLAESGIGFAIVSLFGATEASFRPRAVKRPIMPVDVESPKPVTLPPLVEPEPAAPIPVRHRSLIGRLVGWLIGR